ncbi:uncharacterized protein LOC122539017 [Frieseomelitta varia]|uniref:uncharacterized protein LOC122539017 n=1 Tax=Frieseomelitta varia TaxID=561572 RepID=UPI001CB6AFF8|nr:uncharacterized protein LOC122539017 [Frieseomelitta varia]
MIPKLSSEPATWPHWENLLLADPHFGNPEGIDIILGAEIYGHLLEGSIIKGPSNAPITQASKLGWISGPTHSYLAAVESQAYHCSVTHDLHELLERFWHQEEVSGLKKETLSTTEQDCENHFASTHSRTPAGKYVVRLPLKLPVARLGDSKPSAITYAAFVKEYHNLRHMTRIPDGEPDPPCVFYLPHHGVIRESNSTTKLRVVFNGSCRVANGLPLNEILHTGPKLQKDLFDVLMWFRCFRFIYACDIEKMYRQILVDPEDQIYQRILWIEDRVRIPYQLATVTYGLACAPYLALRVIQQLIKDEGHRFLLAVSVMENGRYVDNIYGGADTIDEAKETALQVSQLCMAGGFPLRKWTSNDPHVLTTIPAQHHNPIQGPFRTMSFAPSDYHGIHDQTLSISISLDQYLNTHRNELSSLVSLNSSTLSVSYRPSLFEQKSSCKNSGQ